MKKALVLVSCFLMAFILFSCKNNEEELTGFNYYELSDYLSHIDGLTNIEPDKETPEIICGDVTVCIGTSSVDTSPSRDDDRLPYSVFELNCLMYDKKYVKDPFGPDGYKYSNVLEAIETTDLYLGVTPNNFAYTLEKYGFNSVPEWQKWIKYDIPFSLRYDPTKGRGVFNASWYDPVSKKYTQGLYVRELDNSTEVFLVYQEMSMFYGTTIYWSPFFVSEEMNEKLKKELGDKYDSEKYTKLSAREAVTWFWGEYLEKLPEVFENVNGDVYIHNKDYDLNGLAYRISQSGLNDISLFIDDMRKIGIDIEKIRCYIIKLTIPHNGPVKDIVWELIG